MVCDRCISSVKQSFEKHNINPLNVGLGEVIVNVSIPDSTLSLIDQDLRFNGFELVDSNTPILVVKIKSAFIELFNKNEIPDNLKLSVFLTEKFPYDYSHLSRVFSQYEKDTIEQYVIKLRIEKAKELLTYKDKNISEVAYKLGYTSAAHFSRQFKKLVGISPSKYQKNPTNRKSLEDI